MPARLKGSARGVSRRDLLRAGATFASTLPVLSAARLGAGGEREPSPRAEEAYGARLAAASAQREYAWPTQGPNDDERELPPYVGMYSKALPHNALGEVEHQAYELLLRALRSGVPRDFEFVPRVGEVGLTNPQAGLGFNLVGPDPGAVPCPPAPRFGSAEQAAEMVELYWQALARDVPFADYASHPLTARAARELGHLSSASLTAGALFRGGAGSQVGPYVSQFLLKEIFFAPLPVVQRFHSAPRGRDHLAAYDHWLDVQNGGAPHPLVLDTVPCFVRNGRDLAEYVHRDFTYQAALSAGLILMRLGVPTNPGNPYAGRPGQSAFVTFGAPHLLYLVATATQAALTACWYQKWFVHRRLRPEELGGRVANHLGRRASYPLHQSLLDSEALASTLRDGGSALLSSSYPEGSPTHPAYPAGHAVVSGAGVTILKAFFDETVVVKDPVVASVDGLSVQRYDGPPLTVGGELDKLATNVGMGRCFAGIHWRSDVEAGLRLGEEVALAVLREVHVAAHEPFAGLRFHRFDGTPVAV